MLPVAVRSLLVADFMILLVTANKATVPGNWFWHLAYLGLLHLKDQSSKFCCETQFCWSVNVKMIQFYVVTPVLFTGFTMAKEWPLLFFFCPGVYFVLGNVKSCAGFVDNFRRAVQAILERIRKRDLIQPVY